MPNYSKVMLMGHLTRDPELRYTTNGTPVCDIGLAVNHKDEASFFDVTFWDDRAETVQEYFQKGDAIFVEGRLVQDRWTTRDGQNRSKVKVVAYSFEFIGGKGEQGRKGGSSAQSSNTSASEQEGDVALEEAEDVDMDSIPF